MTKKNHQQYFEKLKEELMSLGYIRPGSVIRRLTRCGNPACKCMASPPSLHGPYYEWSHKFANKTKSIRLSEEQGKLCETWAQNYKKFKAVARKMEVLSLQATDELLKSAGGEGSTVKSTRAKKRTSK